MRGFFKNFALVFFVGFFAMATALGFGSIGGQILSSNPGLVALRFFGGGLMLAGFAMWIALLRDEAGQPALNPLFALLILASILVLLVNVFDPYAALSAALGWGGIGLAGAALLTGVLAMLIAPAYPQPPTARWPEGGEQDAAPHGAGPH